ncbi:MAG TPA: ABC transporter ATP-binding protein/permease [Stellaceae bacterium]|nr:ABC transporter ATP-binding protein/permease [Stellaceae bacterium]
MTSKGMRHVLREAWRIAKPYWFGEDKWRALGLLAVVGALNLSVVGMTVRFSYWHNDFYNAIQNVDESAFFRLIGIFFALAMVYIALAISLEFFMNWLQVRWRRWLTAHYVDRWLSHRAYYRLQLSGDTDNPDQRIAEDIRLFIENTFGLTLLLVRKVVTLGSFILILWSLSGPVTIPLGSLGEVTIPAYLVWLSIVYAAFGTVLTVKIGRKLVPLNFNRQRYEADFRYSLVRLRENTESVAFYGGESRERAIFDLRFSAIYSNFIAIMWRNLKLGSFTAGFSQASVVFPFLLQAPRFFAKQIKLGDLMQTVGAFGQVLDALTVIVNAYTDIANWQSVVQRLATFDYRVAELEAEGRAEKPIAIARKGDGLAVEALDLNLPDGKALIANVALRAEPGNALLVAGPAGIGKSTLLRAIAGLWPFGRGKVELAEGRAFFVPQKPYIPLGTLRQALIYPEHDSSIPDTRLKEVLAKVGLGTFARELDTNDLWSQRLSGGEQQRLAFARVFLTEPAVIFLDEATSALDEAAEEQIYRMLREAPWRPTIVSVGHRGTLRAFHDSSLDLGVAGARPSAAVAAE